MIDQKFLESLGVTDESAVQKITETYTADIKAEQDAAATAKTQLDEANKTIQSYKDMDIDGIKASVEEYKQKLTQAEAERAAFEYRTKMTQYVKKLGLKNDVYEKHVTDLLTEKNLQFDGDTLIGGDDIVNAFRTSHEDAFAPNPQEQAAAATSGNPPTTLSGVETEFYKMNPNLKQ